MIDVNKSHEVLEALGEPSLEALGRSVSATRADLAEYRKALPRLAARHTQRGMLNWVHDQFFANLLAEFDSKVPEHQVRDAEPRREIYVGDTFRFRFKKHDGRDLVSSYPTESFLNWADQDPPQLLQEIRLIGGYRWDSEASAIGAAVLSARNGRDKVLWAVELDESSEAGVSHFAARSLEDLPSLPTVEAISIEKIAPTVRGGS